MIGKYTQAPCCQPEEASQTWEASLNFEEQSVHVFLIPYYQAVD